MKIENYLRFMQEFRISGKGIKRLKAKYLNDIRNQNLTNKKQIRNNYNYLARYNEPRVKDLVRISKYFKEKDILELLFKNAEHLIQPRSKNVRIKAIKQITNELAYLIGVMCGDGSICKDTYELVIAVSYKDKDYSTFLVNLAKKIFDKKFSTFNCPRCIKLYFKNKIIHTFLTKVVGLQKGIKKGFKIPHLLKRDYDLQKEFVKGFFDTDGSIYIRTNRNYPRIALYQKTKEILKDIQRFLNFLNIKSNLRYKKRRANNMYILYINRKEDIRKFCNMIKSNHPRKFRIMKSFLKQN